MVVGAQQAGGMASSRRQFAEVQAAEVHALPWLVAAGLGVAVAAAASAAALLRASMLAASSCPPEEWWGAVGVAVALAAAGAALAARPAWRLRVGTCLSLGCLTAILLHGVLPAAVGLALAVALVAVAVGLAAAAVCGMLAPGLPAARRLPRGAVASEDAAMAAAVAAFPRRQGWRRCVGALLLAGFAAAGVALYLRWPVGPLLPVVGSAASQPAELAHQQLVLPELPWLLLWLPPLGICWALLLGAGRWAARPPGSAWRLACFAGALPALLCAVQFSILGGAAARLDPPRLDARWQVVAAAGLHHVVYDRASQELQLRRGDELLFGEGPDRPHAELLATLVHALAPHGGRVAVLGLGSGRLPSRLQRASDHLLLDLLDARSEAHSLLGLLQADGPVPTGWRAELPASRLRTFAGFLPALESLAPASRQAVVVGEPLHAGSGWQVVVEVQQALRRSVGSGLVLQPLALDRSPPALLAALLAAAAVAHPWNGLFAVGHTAVLVSAAAEPRWPTPAVVAQWPTEVRWLAHAAHLDPAQDLPLACLGVVLAAPVGPAGASSSILWANRSLLRRWLAPLPGQVAGPHSLLEYWRAREADLQAAERTLGLAGTAGEDPAGAGEAATVPAAAQALAARFLPIGAPRAGLQAALGLTDAQGVRLRNRELATRCAHALDPTFGTQRLPPVLRDLPVPADPTGPLEDFSRLPFGERMVAWCSGEQPRAVALRARFPTAAARALVDALARGPLPPAAQQALRELADPVVLAAAAAAVAARGEPLQALAFWRGDLPLPDCLASAYHADPACREPLLLAVTGRRDAGSRELLAHGMAASEARLRRVAAGVLRDTVGGAIDYDPDWPASQRLAAAERLRTLHNRTP
jgi:hypothetical protein